jgi:hypothetical protein
LINLCEEGFRVSRVQRFRVQGSRVQRFRVHGSGDWAQRVVEFVLFVSFVELVGLNRTN